MRWAGPIAITCIAVGAMLITVVFFAPPHVEPARSSPDLPVAASGAKDLRR